MVATIRLHQRQVREAYIEVALDGAQIDPEFVCQRSGVKLLALIELDEHLREAINECVVIVSSHGVGKTRYSIQTNIDFANDRSCRLSRLHAV